MATDVAIDPTTPTTVYAAFWGQGIYNARMQAPQRRPGQVDLRLTGRQESRASRWVFRRRLRKHSMR
jgi:hypothetical protein